jgi:sugar phosphate isomerase/epimerase
MRNPLGDVDVAASFRALPEIGYNGPMTFQSLRAA